MKMTKKITALLLALVMALSLSTMAFADGTTTTTTGKVTRTTVNSIDAVSSVTIGGTTAYYEKDSNTGDQIYIRAMVAGGSEYSLKSTNVVINLSNAGATINGDLAFTGAGNVRTATNVNLLNKVYTVIISTSEGGVTTSKTYKLAAGLPSGAVSIDGSDPLRIVSIVVGDATDNAITATNAQNPLMGNTVSNKDGKWTFINYKVNSAMQTAPTSRSAVDVALSLPEGTTGLVSGSCLINATTLNLGSSAPVLKVAQMSGTTILDSRDYYVFATDPSTVSFYYGIDFTEAMASDEYEDDDIAAAVDKLNSEAKAFFGPKDGHAAVGTTVMDVMREFALANGYGSEVPAGCTYMATLNGIGEFTFGNMSGWMYTTMPEWNADGTADYLNKWFTPPVGAADYTLTNGANICWFICCDYTHHPWN